MAVQAKHAAEFDAKGAEYAKQLGEQLAAKDKELLAQQTCFDDALKELQEQLSNITVKFDSATNTIKEREMTIATMQLQLTKERQKAVTGASDVQIEKLRSHALETELLAELTQWG